MDKKAILKYIIDEIKSELSQEEIMTLSRVILLEPANQFILDVNESVHTDHEEKTVTHMAFGMIPVKRGYVITSKRNAEVSREEYGDAWASTSPQ